MNNQPEEDSFDEDNEDDLSLNDLAPDGFRDRRNRRRTNFMYREESLMIGISRETVELYNIIYALLTASLSLSFSAMALFSDFSSDVGVNLGSYMLLISQYLHFKALCYFHDLQDLLFRPDHVRTRHPPQKHSSIEDLCHSESLRLTGFTKPQLHQLLRYWRLPLTFRPTERRIVFSGERALLFHLTWLRKGWFYIDMVETFGGDPRDYTLINRYFVRHLYYTFYHKISGDSMRMWIPKVCTFSHLSFTLFSVV
jgi:hypothetical protein